MEIKPKFKINALSPFFWLVVACICQQNTSYGKQKDSTFQSFGTAFPGQQGAKILKYRITAPATPTKITRFYFSTTGCSNVKDIASARVYYTGSADFSSLPLSGTDTCGKPVISPSGSFAVNTSKMLTAGDNYFFLVYNISAAPQIADTLDATLDSVIVADTLWRVSSGNPKGYKTIDQYGTYCPVSVKLPNSKSPQYIGLRSVKIGKSISNVTTDQDKLSQYINPVASTYRQEALPVEIKYGQGRNEQIIGWVDWNNDGFFDAATEQVFYTSSATAAEIYTTSITVPCSATTGAHTLRIMDDIDSAAKLTPCTSPRYGEAEEYIINVLPDAVNYKADFSFTNYTVKGSSVTFTNASTAHGNVLCQWCFSSTCSKPGVYDATGNTAAYTWEKAGNYKVKMVLTWTGCDTTIIKTDTATVTILDFVPLTSSFISDQNIVDTTTAVHFTDLSTGGPSSWRWQIEPPIINGQPTYAFLNGTKYTSQNPVVKFEQEGKYNITLTTNSRGSDPKTNRDGLTSITTKTAYVSVIGHAQMCESNDTITSNSGFIYDDGGPNGPYGNNKSCFLLIKPPCATAVTISFRSFDVSTLGPGTDNLKIFDTTNNLGVPLHAGAGYTNGFKNVNPGNVPTVPPSVTARSGKAFLQWTTDSAFRGDGFIAMWSSTLRSSAPPKASFKAPDTIYLHQTANFVNASTGPELTYAWDLDGDGITDNNQKSPAHTYDTAGVYKVSMIVRNCGGADTMIKKLVVLHATAKPKARFTIPFTRVGASDSLVFTDISTQHPYKWNWIIKPSIGTGSYTFKNCSGFSQNPMITFLDAGQYDVSLVATNEFGSDTSLPAVINVDGYCIPNVFHPSRSIGISRVVIIGPQKDTLLNNPSPAGAWGYTDYHLPVPPKIVMGGTYKVIVSRDTDDVPIRGILCMDYSRDDTMREANDILYYQPKITGKTWTGSFTMKTGQLPGIFRFRVGVDYYYSGKNKDTFTTCGDHTVGEYEDYNIWVQKDTLRPEIKLKGRDTVIIEQGRKYTDAWATVYDQTDGDVTSNLDTTGAVNTSVPGTYIITYRAFDNSKISAVSKIRVVKVIPDTSGPTITLNGLQTMNIEVYNPYYEPGAAVKDNIDTGLYVTIGDSIVDTARVGTYFVSYTSKDHLGNTTVIHRRVNIIDTIKPQVTLLGPKSLKLQILSAYKDSGITASDNYTRQLIINVNKIDTAKRGTQTITYTVSDSSGNTTLVKRTVKVDDFIPPVMKLQPDTVLWDVFQKYTYPTPTAEVSDNYYHLTNANVTWFNDGDHFPKVNDTGWSKIVYYAADSSGNRSKYDTLYIHTVDRIAPTIDLEGDTVVFLRPYQLFYDVDVSIGDNYDYRSWLIETGDFKRKDSVYIYFEEPGLHLVNYKARDHSGNTSRSIPRLFYVTETGIKPDGSPQQMTLGYYPNPANDRLQIDMSAAGMAQTTLVLKDILGRPVQTLYEGNSTEVHLQADISHIARGIYFIDLCRSGRHTAYKLVISGGE